MNLLGRLRQRRARVAPNLSFQERTVQRRSCAQCDSEHILVTAFLLRDRSPYARCYATTCGHSGIPLVTMDVTFGNWTDGSDSDHVTFSCRYRPEGAMAVNAPATGLQTRVMGKQLTRKEALRHPRIDDFWEVADFVCLHDPEVGNELKVAADTG